MFTNTMDFINKFESVIESASPTLAEKDFVTMYELEISNALLKDLDNNSVRRIGKILVAVTDI